MPGRSRSPQLAELLPGMWTIRATTFPLWLSGRRLGPAITYRLLSDEPLRLHDDVTFQTRSGVSRRILGTDVYRHATDDFRWRGNGVLFPLTSVWRVTGVNAEGTVAGIRFARSLLTPAGVDVIARRAGNGPSIEERVRRDADLFGLTSGELESLVWLPRPTAV